MLRSCGHHSNDGQSRGDKVADPQSPASNLPHPGFRSLRTGAGLGRCKSELKCSAMHQLQCNTRDIASSTGGNAVTVQAMMHAIDRSCAIKAEIVALDEREGGVRASLNLGHTFGHAIEAAQGYGGSL